MLRIGKNKAGKKATIEQLSEMVIVKEYLPNDVCL
jgi:hypothetical protein